MADQESTLLTELGGYIDPVLEAEASPSEVEAIALDDATLALARVALRPPWYASWTIGALIPGTPILVFLMGEFGGIPALVDWGAFGLVMLFILGPVVGTIWLALFLGHRRNASGIRQALRLGRALQLNGPIAVSGARTFSIGGHGLETIHPARLPGWVATQPCTAVFAATQPPNRRFSVRNVVIALRGPHGRQLYPPVGAAPALLAVPALAVSILVSIALTSAFNAQSKAYNDAAARLDAINNAVECTPASKPGDDCYTWVAGTIAWEGGYTVTGAPDAPQFSSCRAILRWGASSQEGDVRVDGVDCRKQLTSAPQRVRIQVLQSYAIQVQVAASLYQTDRWPPLGSTVDFLARLFSIGTFVWVAWPIVHVAIAVAYRVRHLIAAGQAGTPSAPEPAPGSAP